MPGAVVESENAQDGDAPVADVIVDDTPVREYTVFRQQVAIEVNFREKSISGSSEIWIMPSTDDLSEVFIDARQSKIDLKNVTVCNITAEAAYTDPYLRLDTPEEYQWTARQWNIRRDRMRPLLARRRKELSAVDHEFKCTPHDGSLRIQLPSAAEIKRKNSAVDPTAKVKRYQYENFLNPSGAVTMYKINIPFVAKNMRDGLHFVGINDGDTRYPHVYTRHSVEAGTASAIFPCIDDPGCRSAWKVSITFPRTLGNALDQALATQQQAKEGDAMNGILKRKSGEGVYRRTDPGLTEEEKLLELTAVCSGILTDEVVDENDETKRTMTFEIEKNKAVQHIGFAVGPFEHVDLWSEFRTEEDDEKLGVYATKIHGYCLPGREEEVRNTCAALVTAADFFAITFGRYPFESYKVCFVDDMVVETVPLCGFSLCSSKILFPETIIDTEYETTRKLIHSLATQWFGVNVVPNLKEDIWLIVGIAWFMTDLCMKMLAGNNEYRFRMKALSDRLVEVDMHRPSLQSLGEHLSLGNFEVDFMNLKAPLVLFILDRRLSKSSGSAGLARIISKMVSKANTSGQQSDEVLTSENFRKACEKAGNTQLESFWNQWIIGSGCPRFDVHQRFNKKRLCVEMTIRQTQDIAAAKARPLAKDDFWRDVMEENHAVYAGELQGSFTGPMTIRIHEADGTPYEHIVEIRDETAKAAKFEIPYNTKYKRLKRNRRQRERAIAGQAAKPNDDNPEDSLLYCLGDVLQGQEEMKDWGLADWDEETEAKMDQESYEWIRMDADFEWICELTTNLQAYMYVSQLQQDRDVVAQQDSMLYMGRTSRQVAHPLISTILTRTLLDTRYFHGIRAMAAETLPRHAVEKLNLLGLTHLMKSFQHFFCYPDTYKPRPNDFSDKRQYLMQCAIPEAVARVRGDDGKCPKEARRFILEQLQGNDNSDNVFSDHFYICKLIKALATCQIHDEKKSKPMSMSMSLTFGDEDEDEDMPLIDPEVEEFRAQAMEEIERYRRMDEYSPSYQNCFTVATLDSLCRLMKAKVIPENAVIFAQYLQDKTIDVVRIKSFECLVELGYMSKEPFLRLFLSVIGTDASPFVRDRLFKILCRGLASIAIGENIEAEKKPQQTEGELIVEQDGAVIDAKQKEKARKEDLPTALGALKEQTKDDEALQDVIWDALDSPILTVSEKRNLLELCSILFEEDDSLVLKFKYPRVWKARRGPKSRDKFMMIFESHFRTKSRKVFNTPAAAPPPPRPEPKRTITLNLNRSSSISIKTSTQPAASTPAHAPVPAPAPASTSSSQPAASAEKPRPTVNVATPKASISVATPVRSALPTATPKSSISAASAKPASAKPASAKPAAAKQASAKPASAKPASAKPAASKPTAKPATKPPPSEPPQEKRRESISVQTQVRPSIELPAPSQASTPAPASQSNGPKSTPLKVPKTLKRQSTETESTRPSKIVRLNTSILPRSERNFKKRSKVIKLPFKAWSKVSLKKRTPEPASIRATPKHHTGDRSAIIVQSPTVATPLSTQQSGTLANSSPPQGATQSSATPTPSLQSQGSSSGNKPARKPLPSAVRHPIPSAAPSTSPSAAATPKAPPKLKIRLSTSSKS